MMDGICRFLVVCLVTGFLVSETQSLVEFTNIQCETLDKEFSAFEYCHLKSVNRSYKYISTKVRLLKVPITKAKVNLGLYKRLNGFKPFLYNVTVDVCKFLRSQTSNPVARYFYDFTKEFSNINHSCPYDHDLVMEKLSTESIDHRVTRLLRFPEGSYMVKTDWFTFNIKRAVIKVHLTIS